MPEPDAGLRQAVIAAIVESTWLELEVRPDTVEVTKFGEMPSFLPGRDVDIKIRMALTADVWANFAPGQPSSASTVHDGS